jgi:uncharacterized protein with HEPN domain
LIDPQTQLLLEDMLSYAQAAVRMVGDLGEAEFAADEAAFLAASRAVEIVCEAAYQVPVAQQAALPSIPWRKVIATRHKYVHGYRTLLASILRETVRRQFPDLIAELQRILNESPTDGR